MDFIVPVFWRVPVAILPDEIVLLPLIVLVPVATRLVPPVDELMRRPFNEVAPPADAIRFASIARRGP